MKLGSMAHIVRGVKDHDSTIDFYKKLGYHVLESGETPTKFTLMTDGVINFLVSQDNFQYTGLIYFDEDQTSRVDHLEGLDIPFFWKQENESSGGIQQAMFEVIPESFGINLVSHTYDEKARPAGESNISLGYFGELAIPLKDFDETASILEKIGFKIMGKYTEPNIWGIAYDGIIPLGLHQTDEIPMNTLTYFNPNSKEVLDDLRSKDLQVTMFGDENGKVTAPDGQDFFIFNITEERLEQMKTMR